MSPSSNPLPLGEQTCFALYAAPRAVTDVYRPMLAEHDLTYPQYLGLLVLRQRDTQPVKKIGAALLLDYGTMSLLLKRLETAGPVSRDRLATDERTVVVSLTDGRAAPRAPGRDPHGDRLHAGAGRQRAAGTHPNTERAHRATRGLHRRTPC